MRSEPPLPDILQDLPIRAAPADVFRAITTADGLDQWWTQRSTGAPVVGSEYELWFGPDYDWRGRVTRAVPDEQFEITMLRSDADWEGTRVGFRLSARRNATWVSFYHAGWPADNEHFRVSAHCWALYLRILRRYVEHGERVPYDDRLST